jgi:hypothetical protein
MAIHNKAVHISGSDTCHHHAMFTNPFILYDAFFLATLRGFATGSADAASAAGFADAEALRFNLAFIAFRLRDTPYEPFHRLPFFDFLSPLPIIVIPCGTSIATIHEIQNSGSLFCNLMAACLFNKVWQNQLPNSLRCCAKQQRHCVRTHPTSGGIWAFATADFLPNR